MLAEAAATALEWDSFVPRGKVTVEVDNGWLTLNGNVSYEYQRGAAERSIRNLLGVRGITNLILVSPALPSARVVKSEIEAALRRHAELDASRISVETSGRKVTLRGKVASWAERRDAERAAWSAPGVALVDDLIAVGG
jgi:osmotically-inducible protein OsmY